MGTLESDLALRVGVVAAAEAAGDDEEAAEDGVAVAGGDGVG